MCLPIDIREPLADSREVFQELPPEAQAKILACVAREGSLNHDRAFVDAVRQGHSGGTTMRRLIFLILALCLPSWATRSKSTSTGRLVCP